MSRKHWIVMFLAFAPGCTTTTHQREIVPTGHGTLIIPSPDLMGASSSSTEKANAYSEAAAYCLKLGLSRWAGTGPHCHRNSVPGPI